MRFKVTNFVYIILYLQFLHPFAIRYLLFPALPKFFEEFITILAFLYFVVMRKGYHKKNSIFFYNIAFLFLIVSFSSVLAGGNALLYVKGLIEYYLPPLLLGIIILSMDLKTKDRKNIIKLILGFSLLQIPVVLIQGFFYRGLSGDASNGTISSSMEGGTGINAIIMNFLFIYYYLKYLLERKKVYLLVMLATLIPIIIGSARFGFVTLGVILLVAPIILLHLKMLKFLRSTLGIIISIMLIIVLFFLVKDYLGSSEIKGWDVAYSIFTDKEKIFEYGGLYEKQGRLGDYLYISEKQDSIIEKIFGFGGDYFVQSNVLQSKGEGVKYLTSQTFGVRIFSSLGIAGILFFVFMFTKHFFLIKKIIKDKKLYSNVDIELALITFIFIIPFVAVYSVFWDSQLSVIYFFLLGLILNESKMIKEV